MTELSCLKPKMNGYEYIENNSIENKKHTKELKNLLMYIIMIIKNVFSMKKYYIKNFIIYN